MKKQLQQITKIAHDLSGTDQCRNGSVPRFHKEFSDLTAQDRLAFYRWLANDLEVQPEDLKKPLDRVRKSPANDPLAWGRRLGELRAAVASPRRRIFENLVNTHGGMKFVLDLRAEILEFQRNGQNDLELLDREIADLLNGWFRQGFLFLKEINLSSSFDEIRFLKERELVHPMLNLEEMGNRLGEDRMCFALYHAAMPKEPVVFIEVALSRGLIQSIHHIIDDRSETGGVGSRADTAIFYSINNTQNGLAGLGLGKVLIFQVTEALKKRHPGLRTFATLSPIPGFLERYLAPILDGADEPFLLKRGDLLKKFSEKLQKSILEKEGSAEDFSRTLLGILSREDWVSDPFYFKNLKKPLTDIGFFYLSEEKGRKGKPLNPVANFHIENGATLSPRTLNYGANLSPRGLRESCGLMVNYIYSSSIFEQVSQALQSLMPWAR